MSDQHQMTRSLADDLRGRDDDALVKLFEARPDLSHPHPVDLGSVAARAATRASSYRALSLLNARELGVAVALTVLAGAASGGVSLAALARACQTKPPQVRPVALRLLELGLVFGTTRAMHPVRVLAELFGPNPAGLAAPVADLLAGSPGRLMSVCSTLGIAPEIGTLEQVLGRSRDLLDDAPPALRADIDTLLERVEASGSGTGQVQNARRELFPFETNPVTWLLAHGLLIPVSATEVALPREAAIGLRGGVLDLPVEPEAVPTTGSLVERVAPGAATDLVRQVSDLIGTLDRTPASVLRSGGIGLREHGRLNADLGIESAASARALLVAAGAGLIAVDERDQVWRPTAEADDWLEVPTGVQWGQLVTGWASSELSAALVGRRDERGTVLGPLAPGTRRPVETALRRALLDLLADWPAGSSLDPDRVRDALRFRHPFGPLTGALAATKDLLTTVLDDVLDDAAHLGLVAFGSFPGYAREAAGQVRDGEVVSGDGLAALLPDPIERVHVLADLTAVAPGPLARPVADLLELAADVESRGGATVFRFTPGSIRRALKAGHDGPSLLAALAGVCDELPQPLAYLVTDTARRHGVLRVGAASSYLRCADPALLTEVLNTPGIAGLGWGRLAPTVVATTTDPEQTLAVLERHGIAGLREHLDGSLVVTVAKRRRAPAPNDNPSNPDVPTPAELVALLRRVEQVRQFPSEQAGAGTEVCAELAIDVLRESARRSTAVTIEFADALGRPVTMHAQPLEVSTAVVRVVELGTGRVVSIGRHRLIRVSQSSPGT